MFAFVPWEQTLDALDAWAEYPTPRSSRRWPETPSLAPELIEHESRGARTRLVACSLDASHSSCWRVPTHSLEYKRSKWPSNRHWVSRISSHDGVYFSDNTTFTPQVNSSNCQKTQSLVRDLNNPKLRICLQERGNVKRHLPRHRGKRQAVLGR